MDRLEVIKEAGRKGREAFERCVASTGLEIADVRPGGYLITGWGNKDKDIEGELNRNGIDFTPVGRGAYIVNEGPFVKSALQEIVPPKVA